MLTAITPGNVELIEALTAMRAECEELREALRAKQADYRRLEQECADLRTELIRAERRT